MDREYTCGEKFVKSEEHSCVAYDTAERILRADGIAKQAKNVGGKLCVLGIPIGNPRGIRLAVDDNVTNIQCAPCEKTDKLLVRLLTVPEGALCPSTYRQYTVRELVAEEDARH